MLCSCFPLAIYFTFGSVYMSMPLSHFVPASSSPSPCPQVHSLHLRLYSCPAPRFFRTIFFSFRFHIYMFAYGICFSLSDFTLYDRLYLGPSTSLQITQFRVFLWLCNIPLYICATSSLSIQLDSVSQIDRYRYGYRYIDINRYIFFFRLFSIIGYYKILNIVPCAIQ